MSGGIDVGRIRDELVAFLAGDLTSLEHAFDGARVELPGAAGPNTWAVDGVVKGAYRVTPIGGPDPTRRMALGAGLTVRVDDGPDAGAHGTVETGPGQVRIELDRPEILLRTLPLGPDASDVVRALAGADIRVEVHGRGGRIAVLDPA